MLLLSIGPNLAQNAPPQDGQAVWGVSLAHQILDEWRSFRSLKIGALFCQQIFVRPKQAKVERFRSAIRMIVEAPPFVVRLRQGKRKSPVGKIARRDANWIERAVAESDI